MPFLAFPQVLGGTGPVAYLVLAVIVVVMLLIVWFLYRQLQEEP